MGLSTKLSWDDPRVWGGLTPWEIYDRESRRLGGAHLQDLYGQLRESRDPDARNRLTQEIKTLEAEITKKLEEMGIRRPPIIDPMTPAERAKHLDQKVLLSPSFYGASGGRTRPPGGSVFLGESGGFKYWVHSLWGYMRMALPTRHRGDFRPSSPKMEQIPREKVPSELLGRGEYRVLPPIAIIPSWGTIILLALAFLTLRRRT